MTDIKISNQDTEKQSQPLPPPSERMKNILYYGAPWSYKEHLEERDEGT